MYKEEGDKSERVEQTHLNPGDLSLSGLDEHGLQIFSHSECLHEFVFEWNPLHAKHR